MKIATVENEYKEIQNKLFPIRDEMCLIHNRNTKQNVVIFLDKHLDFVVQFLNCAEVNDFTQKMAFDLHNSDELNNCLITGNTDIISHVTL